jgi:riboflavin synthase
MFTGLVEQVGEIHQISSLPGGGVQLTVRAQLPVSLGDSIAVNGCCLTVTSYTPHSLTFDASAETLRCTNFADLLVGSQVNLERALEVGARLGGHFVSGHVDCVGFIETLVREGEFLRVGFSVVHLDARSLLIPKGSICCDGVSLTINRIEGTREKVYFEVMLIPATQEQTIFREAWVGKRVNIEFDLIGKYVNSSILRSPQR